MGRAALLVLLRLLAAQDPADDLRRQELALRLQEMADKERLEPLSKAMQRELRGRKIDGPLLTLCWKIASGLPKDRLEEFIKIWDKVASAEPPGPGSALLRARLENLAGRPPAYHEKLEEAAKKHPGQGAILWYAARVRFDAGDHAGAARALEEVAASKDGYVYDLDDFHSLLVQCYGLSGRRAAAIEHLRALRDERYDLVDLAQLAARSALPSEAARLYRLAMAQDPERISLRMGLIRALNAAGEDAEAGAERRQMFLVNGRVVAGKVEDYFFLLPPEGRPEEIARTLRELLGREDGPVASVKLFESLVVTVPVEDRGEVSAAWEKQPLDAPGWVVLAHMKRAWGNSFDSMIETLDKGEKAFPNDPWFPHQRMEPLRRLSRFKDIAAAYDRLVRLDPEGKRTGPRPFGAIQEAIRGLAAQKDMAEALRLGVQVLSEPGLDEATIRETRGAMRPAWEISGPGFWDEVRKLRLRPAEGVVATVVQGHIQKLSEDEFEVRNEASRQLLKIGLPAVPALLERIDDKDVEIRSRAREIVRSIFSE